AKIRRCEDHPPRRIQLAAGDQAMVEVAVGVKYIDDPQAGSVQVVGGRGILLRVADVQLAADGRDVKWRKSARQVRVGETAGQVNELKLLVENVDLAVMEVRHVKEIAGGVARQCNPLVDGSISRREARLGSRVWRHGRVPSGNLTRLRREDE